MTDKVALDRKHPFVYRQCLDSTFGGPGRLCPGVRNAFIVPTLYSISEWIYLIFPEPNSFLSLSGQIV